MHTALRIYYEIYSVLGRKFSTKLDSRDRLNGPQIHHRHCFQNQQKPTAILYNSLNHNSYYRILIHPFTQAIVCLNYEKLLQQTNNNNLDEQKKADPRNLWVTQIRNKYNEPRFLGNLDIKQYLYTYVDKYIVYNAAWCNKRDDTALIYLSRGRTAIHQRVSFSILHLSDTGKRTNTNERGKKHNFDKIRFFFLKENKTVLKLIVFGPWYIAALSTWCH